jgi:hypothetical protein
VRYVFKARPESEAVILGVLCDLIEGEARNLGEGLEIIKEIKNPEALQYDGIFFITGYDSYDGARRSLKDMPSPEMAEAVRAEYDKKLDSSKPKEGKKRGDSKFGDFSLITVAAISAFRRKRQSIIVSRDRWIRLACEALHDQFKLQLYCQDQHNFSVQEITDRIVAKRI